MTQNIEAVVEQPQPHLIKNGQVIEDTWQVIALPEAGQTASIPAGNVLLPLAVWQSQKDSLKASGQALGLWLEPADDVTTITADLAQFAVIAIHFPKFSDGRGYSNARLIRERYGFTGEIRAVGDVLHDQLYFMKRVGFDAFALLGHKNVELALNGAFKTFSTPYQHAVDTKEPLFRRRAV
ncbi:MAG: hypothetical protein RIR18_557 [Pseudomonadota bacterium]|jgi:uncharacterized protein (DUF934 family)